MARLLLEDTRQQAGKHEFKHAWWRAAGIGIIRSKLPFGDYCLPPAAAVDTKASIAELAYDIDQDHERFRRELVGARDAGIALTVLVENDEGVSCLDDLAAWRESGESFARRRFAQRRHDGARLAKACATMAERYGCTFLFCAPDESARVICEILGGGFDGAGDAGSCGG